VEIHWLIVLGAFLGGLALALSLLIQALGPNRWLIWLSRGLAGGLLLGALAGLVLNWPEVVTGFAPPRALGSAAVAPTPTFPPATASATPAAQTLTALALVEPTTTPEPPRLLIPTFSVNEPVITIPIRDEQWDISGLDGQVGWLMTTGARPGDFFGMVLIGHITRRDYSRGAFADLESARAGLEILYQADGIEYVYEVTERGRVPPNDVKELYVNDGNVLLLMTCTDWDGSTRTYANRLLVRAELKEQRPIASR
jgi:LPXTG-site transpeptidase (sortase) family protein